jgi:hypothetical protein
MPFAEAGESLSALWIARYAVSGNERKRVHGVPRCPTEPVGGSTALSRGNLPQMDCDFFLITAS